MGETGAGGCWTELPRSRRLRWTPDDRLVVSGGDQDQPPARMREAVLVQRTGDLMYGLLTMYHAISGLHPEYGWDASYGETADRLIDFMNPRGST